MQDKMIKRTVEVGLLVMGKERLAEGFAPEVMLSLQWSG